MESVARPAISGAVLFVVVGLMASGVSVVSSVQAVSLPVWTLVGDSLAVANVLGDVLILVDVTAWECCHHANNVIMILRLVLVVQVGSDVVLINTQMIGHQLMFSFGKKSLICLEGRSTTSRRGKTILFFYSQQLSGGPLKGFLN